MEIKMIDLDNNPPATPSQNTAPAYESKVSKPMSTQTKTNIVPLVIAFIIFAIGGFYSGAVLKTSFSGKSLVGGADMSNVQAEIPQAGVRVGDIYGSTDEKAFNTTATGVIDKGGLNGEGTHHLVRPGGISQTVYMTSSVIDLDTLVGHQVTVWGETFKGQKTGWLMDVGRVKVENLNMPLPE